MEGGGEKKKRLSFEFGLSANSFIISPLVFAIRALSRIIISFSNSPALYEIPSAFQQLISYYKLLYGLILLLHIYYMVVKLYLCLFA